MKSYPPSLWMLASFLAALSAQAQPWGAKPFGILLLGHGGGSEWNQAVLGVQKAVSSKKVPVEIAFGMADPAQIQRAMDRLKAQRVARIIAVPLFISSYSEVLEQTKYVLGMRKTPSDEFMTAPHSHMAAAVVRRARTDLPLVMTQALDDHALVADILLDRARKMSRNPSKEYVVLVGHGPLKDSDNELWLGAMDRLGRSVRRRGGFAGVRSATLRDDSPPAAQMKAEKALRDLVKDLSRQGRVLVVPHLIASGGIERHIRRSLDGLFYSWTGETLLPDRRIAQWVIETAQKSSTAPSMRQFKDEGRPLPPPERKRIIPLEEPSKGPPRHTRRRMSDPSAAARVFRCGGDIASEGLRKVAG